MLPVDSVCLILLMFASHLHGEAIGHIHTHFGSRVNTSAIQNINFIEVSTFSRLKSFAQCAKYFKSQHLVFFDGKIERAYDPRRQQQYEKYRLKCAPVSAKTVTDNKRKLSEGTQQDDGYKKVQAQLCGKKKLNTEDYIAQVSSSHEDQSEKTADVFIRSRYEVATQTGYENGAGTSSKVYLEVIGEDASHVLFLRNTGNPMIWGQNDTFKFSSPCNIGKIARMSLSIPSILTIDQWFCIQINLQRELEYTRHSEVEVLYSNQSRWLPSLSLNNIVGGSVDDIAYTRLETYRKDF